MRKPVPEIIEKIMENANSNIEIQKLYEKNSKFETELEKAFINLKN